MSRVRRLSRVPLSALLFAVLVVLPDALLARSLEAIRQSGEIRVCIAPIHPSIAVAEPPGCRDDCAFSGPAFEEALAFVSTLGGDIAPVFRRIDWDEQFHDSAGMTKRQASYTPELLASGACDLYPNHLTITDWRLKKLDIVPLVRNRMMVIVQESQKDRFNDPADLAGKVTAVQKDTSFHSWLQAQNETLYASEPVEIRLVETDSVFERLDAGQIDFAITDANAAIWSIRHELERAAVAFPVGETEQIGWGLRKEDQDLQAAVGAFFEEQRASQASDLNRIWETHFGVSLTRFETLVRALK